MARPKLKNPVCYKCGSHDTTHSGRDGHEIWCHNRYTNNKVYCWNCYCRYIKNPRQNSNRQYFRGKRYLHKVNPRIGKCSKCGRKGLTHLHHEDYGLHPLDNTVELCPSCHAKRGFELGQLVSIEENKERV